jgi:hypothetical protein
MYFYVQRLYQSGSFMLQREFRVRINRRKGPQRSTVCEADEKVKSFQVSERTWVCQQRLLRSKAESVTSSFFANLSAIDRSGPFLQSNGCTAITITTVLHEIHSLLQQRHLACDCLLYAPLGTYPVEKPPALRQYDIKFININEMYLKK